MVYRQLPLPGAERIVNEFNKVQGTQNIFALGDQSLQTSDKKWPNGHPQLAQVAIQHGDKLASNLIREADNKPMEGFVYNDKG